MKSWSIGKKLFAGVGALLVLSLVIGGVALIALAKIQGNMETAAGITSEKLILTGELLGDTEGAWAAEKAANVNTFTKNRTVAEEFMKLEKDKLGEISDDVNKMKPLLVTEAGKAALARLAANLSVWQSLFEQVNQLNAKNQPTKAYELSATKVKPVYREILKDSLDLRERTMRLMLEGRESGAREYASARWEMFVMLLVAFTVGAFIVWSVRSIVSTLRHSVSELGSGGEQVASASTQIASTSQSLSQGASEQAASLEEISASMEEMTAMTKRNGENSAEATAMMAETNAQVERSNQALQEMVVSMGAIKVSSEKVAKINKTIDEIAFQTNILALNAAVEAARAGEAGMGFAVVADEVRNLAQRSAVAAKDTAALIEESIQNSNEGAAKLDQVAAAIQAITDSAGKVKNLVDEVNEASKQQVQGIDQVSTAVQQVSQVTQTAAASAEESAAAAQELSAQSQTVRELVTGLRRMVDGGGSSKVNHTAPAKPKAAKKPASTPAPAVKKGPSSEELFPMEATGTDGFRSF